MIRLLIFRTLCFIMLSCHASFAQSRIDNFIDSLSNDSLQYVVSKVGTTKIGKNNTIELQRILVTVESINVKSILTKKNKALLINRLISELKNPDRDWYANVILYAITERDATSFSVINGREDWINFSRQSDIIYWTKFQERTNNEQ